jgi:hypothetical protein
MKLFRTILWVQGIYYLLTAIWPLIAIKSFMMVTGYKHDVWLVKTVGALLIAVSLTMLSYLFIKTDRKPVYILCITSPMAFACIDFYYSLTDVISNIYLVDGFIQLGLIMLWVVIVVRRKA